MEQDDSSLMLDDAAVRHAVQSAWGQGAASSDLRRRVLMAMTRTVLEQPEIPEVVRTPRFWDRWPAPLRVGSAIAALLAIAVSLTWGIVLYSQRPSYSAAPPRDFIKPPAEKTLYALLVSRHDDFSAGSEADPEDRPLTPERLATLRTAFSAQLHHSVWVPDLTKIGWKLTGARLYTVNGVTAPAFNFSRGPDVLTAFSLPVAPATEECMGSTPDLDLVVDNRSFSSFSTGGQLFALVASRGSGPYPQADLRTLVNQFRDDPSAMGVANCSALP